MFTFLAVFTAFGPIKSAGAAGSDFCSGDLGKQAACVLGYSNGYEGKPSGCEKFNGENRDICIQSFNIGKYAKAAGVKSGETLPTPEACKNGSFGDKVACLKGAGAAASGTRTKEEACSDVSTGQKEKCFAGFTAGAAGGGPNEAEPDCDTELSSPLSWIACPLIDSGVAFTDYIFGNFIEPLLSNVPVSANSKDGTYVAWQQFRILGNIIMIGSLLAVVYSQVKGGR